jgi:hypothetical protein
MLTTAGVRLGLWLLPFRVLNRAVARLARPARALTRQPLERVIWSVHVASRFVPRATCLTQSLAAQILLARRGYPAALRLGVAREAGQFDAHAWLESNGRVVIGNADLWRYTPMTAD